MSRDFVSKETTVWRIQNLISQVLDCRPNFPSWFNFPEMRTTLNFRHPGRGLIL